MIASSRIPLLAVLAVCALLAKLAPEPVPQLDSSLMLVNGVRLGMTQEEVASLRGLPPAQRLVDHDTMDWSYPDLTVALKSDSRGHRRVVFAHGNQLTAGSARLPKIGDSEQKVRRELSSLGPPKVLDIDHHCGEWFPAFEDGALDYPGGLSVWFSNGRVCRFSIAQDGQTRGFEPCQAQTKECH